MNFHPALPLESQHKVAEFFSKIEVTIPDSAQICPIELELEPNLDWFDIRDLDVKVSFDNSNDELAQLRRLFVKPVTFIGGGPGDPDLITVAGMKALQECEVCFYDALIDQALLSYLPKHAEAVYVGKRAHNHSTKQKEICRLLQNAARNGLRVVRLKGGDSGIFGRLTEEVEALTELQIPFKVIPGISSFIAATTGTGLLLTRRDIARGFRIQTPRGSEGSITLPNKTNLPATEVFFMAISCMKDLADTLIESGRDAETPVSIIFSAGTADTKIVSGNLRTIYQNVENADLSTPKPPGLIIVGDTADAKYLYKNFSPLFKKRIFIGEFTKENSLLVRDFGAIPVSEKSDSDYDLSNFENIESFCSALLKLANKHL